MSDKLILALPSKGRLMEQSLELFAGIGMPVTRIGHERGYRGEVKGLGDIEVAFLSASEIADSLKSGRVHLGGTGEDLVRENISNWDSRVDILKRLGFGRADVVVAVPAFWIDVQRVGDIEEIADRFRRNHQRRLRLATKYTNLSRRFFAQKGVTSYRTVESLGATEGTPETGTADLIVDITSTGTTLKANHLKMLDDGVILRSEACLVASRQADWASTACEVRNEIVARIGD